MSAPIVDPVEVLDAINDCARSLDAISKELAEANQRMDRAEAAWDLVYDAVAESLKDEMVEEGRKGDPAEHWITGVTRRQHRIVYQELRNAKRAVERLDRQLKAKSNSMSGRQTLYKGLHDEAAYAHHAAQDRRPRMAA